MWEKELQSAIEAGLLAKEKIMEIYKAGFDVKSKKIIPLLLSLTKPLIR